MQALRGDRGSSSRRAEGRRKLSNTRLTCLAIDTAAWDHNRARSVLCYNPKRGETKDGRIPTAEVILLGSHAPTSSRRRNDRGQSGLFVLTWPGECSSGGFDASLRGPAARIKMTFLSHLAFPGPFFCTSRPFSYIYGDGWSIWPLDLASQRHCRPGNGDYDNLLAQLKRML